MEPLVIAGVVLDLSHGIVVLLFSDHELPAIRRRELLRFWVAYSQAILWGGIACLKEKPHLRVQMYADANQHRFLDLSRPKEWKGISQHVNAW